MDLPRLFGAVGGQIAKCQIGVAAGGSALVTLRDCAASASMRWGDGDGAGVGAAGGGLNCANFGIFPVILCN